MTFRFDKLTIKAQEAVEQAQSLASEQGHSELDTLHLLAALVGEQIQGNWTLHVSDHAGIDIGKLNQWSIELTA